MRPRSPGFSSGIPGTNTGEKGCICPYYASNIGAVPDCPLHPRKQKEMPQPRVTSTHTYNFTISGQPDADVLIEELRKGAAAVGKPNQVRIVASDDQRDGYYMNVTVTPVTVRR